MEVLQEAFRQEVVPGDLDDRRDDVLARLARGTPAPFAHDELEVASSKPFGRDPSHDDRLEDADLADRVHELGQLVLVEDRARLARVRADVVERDLGEFRPGTGRRPVSVAAAPSSDGGASTVGSSLSVLGAPFAPDRSPGGGARSRRRSGSSRPPARSKAA